MRVKEVPPSERLVLAVYVTIMATAALTVLEIVYMVGFFPEQINFGLGYETEDLEHFCQLF